MKKILSFFLVAFLLISCNDDKNDCCINIDRAVSIKYLNDKGENLLDIEGGIKEINIKLYHKVDNKWVYYFEGNLDSPKGIRIIEREVGNYLVIYPSATIVENNCSETKIEFSKTDYDIIKTEINKSNSNEIVTKVWYNDELKWEAHAGERKFEIIK